MYKYLYPFLNIYNNKEPIYLVTSLDSSDIGKIVIFGGKNNKPLMLSGSDQAIAYLYIEVDKKISDENSFKNLQRLLNIISLVSFELIEYEKHENIDCFRDFDDIYDSYESKTYYDPAICYGGQIGSRKTKDDIFVELEQCIVKLNTANKKDFEKIDNAIHIYNLVLKLERLPNPHMWYSLCMTLFASIFDQLAPPSKKVCEYSFEKCPGCGEPKQWSHQTSKRDGIDFLIRNASDDVKGLIGGAYGKRSSFIHHGNLFGNEKDGGYFVEWGSDDSKKLIENLMNMKVFSRQLILDSIKSL